MGSRSLFERVSRCSVCRKTIRPLGAAVRSSKPIARSSRRSVLCHFPSRVHRHVRIRRERGDPSLTQALQFFGLLALHHKREATTGRSARQSRGVACTSSRDYLFFVDRQAVGNVEAKPAGMTLTGAIQIERDTTAVWAREKPLCSWRRTSTRCAIDRPARLPSNTRCQSRHTLS